MPLRKWLWEIIQAAAMPMIKGLFFVLLLLSAELMLIGHYHGHECHPQISLAPEHDCSLCELGAGLFIWDGTVKETAANAELFAVSRAPAPNHFIRSRLEISRAPRAPPAFS